MAVVDAFSRDTVKEPPEINTTDACRVRNEQLMINSIQDMEIDHFFGDL